MHKLGFRLAITLGLLLPGLRATAIPTVERCLKTLIREGFSTPNGGTIAELIESTLRIPHDDTNVENIDDRFALIASHFQEVVAELGNGGMGKIYDVTEQATGERFALKLANNPTTLLVEYALTNYLHARFAEIHPRIRNPFLPTVWRADWQALTMPIGVRALHPANFGSSRLNAAIASLEEMLFMVRFIHSQNIIHRDVKPSNFLEMPGGGLAFIDFALATPEGRYRSIDAPMKTAGTTSYFSLSQMAGASPNRGMDTHGFRVTAMELLLGREVTDTELRELGITEERRFGAKNPNRFTTFTQSPHTIDPKIPPALSAVFWYPTRDLEELNALFHAAKAYLAQEEEDRFFTEVYGPKFRELIQEDVYVAADLLVSSMELLEAYGKGLLGFAIRQEPELLEQCKIILNAQPSSQTVFEFDDPNGQTGIETADGIVLMSDEPKNTFGAAHTPVHHPAFRRQVFTRRERLQAWWKAVLGR